jgi:hypothetical protein
MGVDDDSSEHPLRLHFAIIAYRAMLSRNDPRVMQLARFLIEIIKLINFGNADISRNVLIDTKIK